LMVSAIKLEAGTGSTFPTWRLLKLSDLV